MSNPMKVAQSTRGSELVDPETLEGDDLTSLFEEVDLFSTALIQGGCTDCTEP